MREREGKDTRGRAVAGVLSAVTRTYLSRYYRIEEELLRELRELPGADNLSGCCVAYLLPQAQAAVAMAENLLRYTTWVPLETVAESRLLEQNEWRADLIGAWEHCEGEQSAPDDLALLRRRSEAIVEDMSRRLRQVRLDNSLNADYLRATLVLEEKWLALSELFCQMPLCPALLTLLQRQSAARRRQLASLAQLLRRVPPC